MKKKILSVMISFAFAATLLAGCGKEKVNEDATEEASVTASTEEAVAASTEDAADAASTSISLDPNPTELDDAIALAVFDYNNKNFEEGECSGEGHILMAKEGEDDADEQTCYLLTMFGKYEFENGNFVKCAGTGAIPAVVTFERDEEGIYRVKEYQEAEDGSGFVGSIKKLFPEDLWSRCITIEDEDNSELVKMEQGYAEEYLAFIGREDAEIGEFGDFEYKIDSDYGISDEVSNKLMDLHNSNNFINNCPYWYGDREVIEGGIRYIYSKEIDEKAKKVLFSKREYGNDDVIIESAEYSTKTGEPIK